ncbi:MAG TPA: ABC transporter substrate-binding protein [Trebonia sp.]|jgi:branched-chain amino acid transport system substrate-binding protein|nr:ABC transporter substrate-binding protein [Trebonia sp.]
MKRLGLIAGAAVVAVTAAACSSSSTSASSGASSPASASSSTGASSSAAGLPTAAAAASGTPYKVFFINEQGASATASDPEDTSAATAAVDYINKNLGGIKGRPVQMTTCATLGTSESMISCANKAVDAKADIVIKGAETAAESGVPIITGAGIPYLTLNAGSAGELNNKLSFVPSAGFAAQYSSLAVYAKSKGYKNVVAVFTDVTALSSPLQGPIAKAFAREGITYSTLPVALTTSDLTPTYDTALAKKPDLILDFASLAQCTALLNARQTLSDTTPLAIGPNCATSSVLNSVSSQYVNGLAVASPDTSTVSTDKDTQTYDAAMKAYAPSASTGGFAPTSFEAVMDFYNAMTTAADPASVTSPSAVAQVLSTSKNIPLFMGAGKSFTCSHTLFPTLPAACSPYAFVVTYTGNGVYSLVGSYDMTALMKGLI